MSSRQNPLQYILVVAIVMVVAVGGPLSLSRVLWKSAYSRPNMKPKSIPKEAPNHVPFILHSFVCMFRHFLFICMHLPFILH